MKPITTTDLSPGIRVAAARTKAALRATVLRDLRSKAELSALTAGQLEAIAESAAESAMVRIVTAGSAIVAITVNMTPAKRDG
jgi:hypothetical protein